ncbi:hypothetical protein DSCA_26080 [Desulfosarcina alkanivorans]|uniref:Uncharacterized protein n=1 Tax=Desulfosarcina alkanivorans TaxID=571177 RepID=A0A5K7YIA8_9BACT|nr:hypothetical protein DSCA_26080 [Desulfosarcina alkanivorans]
MQQENNWQQMGRLFSTTLLLREMKRSMVSESGIAPEKTGSPAPQVSGTLYEWKWVSFAGIRPLSV